MLALKSITSDDRSIVPGFTLSYLSSRNYLYFHYASEFGTQILAYMLDSLVRVSRRVDSKHFVRIANGHLAATPRVKPNQHSGHCPQHQLTQQKSRAETLRRPLSIPQSNPWFNQQTITGPETLPFCWPSATNQIDSDPHTTT
jgi:hypothetical protein